MRIVADENIPYVREAFGRLGDVDTLPGRGMTREALTDAELLLVRSVTRVDAALLDGTPVRFVATATIGEDHIDRAWLASRGIGFSSAPGCNAESVADYMSAALLALAERHGLDLAAMSAGVVGVGNVGFRVAKRLQALGMRVVLNDPPLAEETGDPRYRPLEEALDCDLVTLHVPLEKAGPHPTHHLVDGDFIARMRPGAIFCNTARGGVARTEALLAARDSGRLRALVLDVWEREPTPDNALVPLADIATPHIAGYSFDGKVNGTRQIHAAACAFLGVDDPWDPDPLLPPPDVPEWTVDPDDPGGIHGVVRAVYDILRDDAAFRELLALPSTEQGPFFDRLRKTYPRRREFSRTRVRLARPDARVAGMIAGLGFPVEGTA